MSDPSSTISAAEIAVGLTNVEIALLDDLRVVPRKWPGRPMDSLADKRLAYHERGLGWRISDFGIEVLRLTRKAT